MQGSRNAMPTTPACPQCTLENTYPDGTHLVCADCGYEWPLSGMTNAEAEAEAVVKDANGNILSDGDAVVLIKDLKVKGSSITLKMGSKVKSIRLVGSGDHEVDCKMDAGNFMLKACFLKKV
jgi:protein PhnA